MYDVSTFIEAHPGGEVVIRQLAGNDVTDEFFELHRRDVLTKYPNLIIGRLDSAKAKVDTTGSLSKVPFAEIPAMAGQFSPYYNDTHRAFLQGARKFVQKELVPMSAAKDLEGSYPERETLSKIGMAGMYAARLGPGPWMKELTELGITLPGGVKPEEFGKFCLLLYHLSSQRTLLAPPCILILGTFPPPSFTPPSLAPSVAVRPHPASSLSVSGPHYHRAQTISTR